MNRVLVCFPTIWHFVTHFLNRSVVDVSLGSVSTICYIAAEKVFVVMRSIFATRTNDD